MGHRCHHSRTIENVVDGIGNRLSLIGGSRFVRQSTESEKEQIGPLIEHQIGREKIRWTGKTKNGANRKCLALVSNRAPISLILGNDETLKTK
jgi:hypothetical protein